jgi:hypothetical protein
MQPLLLPDGINGHPAIEFDGVDDFLQITKAFDVETGAVTVFAVASMPDSSVCAAVFESSNGSEDNDISLGSYMQMVNWEVLDTADENASFDQGVPVIVSGSADTDGTGYVVTNGVVASTLTNFDVPAKLQRLQTFIGKTLYANCQTYPGRIGEVIVYNRALSLEETLAVQKYLGNVRVLCELTAGQRVRARPVLHSRGHGRSSAPARDLRGSSGGSCAHDCRDPRWRTRHAASSGGTARARCVGSHHPGGGPVP